MTNANKFLLSFIIVLLLGVLAWADQRIETEFYRGIFIGCYGAIAGAIEEKEAVEYCLGIYIEARTLDIFNNPFDDIQLNNVTEQEI